MVKRRTIGLIYQYNENWIGGTYYIQNLISALNCLPDEIKPNLLILTNEIKQYEDLRKSAPYPYIKGRNLMRGGSLVEKINKITRKLINRKVVRDYHTDIDLVFPANHEARFKPMQKFLYWIPDFQEHYLPHFFTKEEIAGRKLYQSTLIFKARFILFSSFSVQKDFNLIYPNNKMHQFIVPFAVTHNIRQSNYSINEKYKIPRDYFICCNQFWQHKNHIVVLKALASLLMQGKDYFVIFTGKESDYRDPEFFESLKQKAKDMNVLNNIAFLGFINREDQIALIQQSRAVVQPSLFEGWSTIIEDAKALTVAIIASNISVHQEQLNNYEVKQFFDPHSEQELADCMEKSQRINGFTYDYQMDIVNFGKAFQQATNYIIENH